MGCSWCHGSQLTSLFEFSHILHIFVPIAVYLQLPCQAVWCEGSHARLYRQKAMSTPGYCPTQFWQVPSFEHPGDDQWNNLDDLFPSCSLSNNAKYQTQYQRISETNKSAFITPFPLKGAWGFCWVRPKLPSNESGRGLPGHDWAPGAEAQLAGVQEDILHQLKQDWRSLTSLYNVGKEGCWKCQDVIFFFFFYIISV